MALLCIFLSLLAAGLVVMVTNMQAEIDDLKEKLRRTPVKFRTSFDQEMSEWK